MKNELSRRRFLKLAGSAIISLAAGCGFSTPPDVSNKLDEAARPTRKIARALTRDTTLDAHFVRQIVTEDNRTSRTVMWNSRDTQAGSEVAFRLAGTEEYTVVPATTERYTDDKQDAWIHTAFLDPLTPGKEYEYRLLAGDQGSPWMPLKTDSGRSFTCLIFPDSQCSDGYVTWRSVAQTAVQRTPNAALLISMGDLVDNGEDHKQWNQWFNGLDGVLNRLPFAPVMGNHETYTIDWQTRLPVAYLSLFSVPNNGSSSFGRYYYSFDYGDVHFAVINTQMNEIDDLRQGLLEEQLAWLPRDLAASAKKWKIVLMHRDVLRYGIHSRPDRRPGIDKIGQTFMPIFDEAGVDAVLTAHLHTYRDRGRLYDFQPSEQGPLYLLTGVAGNVRYPGLWVDHKFDKVIAPQPETDNYLTLDASPEELVFRCFLPNGTIIDEARLKK